MNKGTRRGYAPGPSKKGVWYADDVGIVADGGTDCGALLNKVLGDMSAAGAHMLIMPASPFPMMTSVTIVGQSGVQIYGNNQRTGASTGIQLLPNSDCDVYKPSPASPYGGLHNMWLLGARTQQTAGTFNHGINTSTTTLSDPSFMFFNVRISGMTGHGYFGRGGSSSHRLYGLVCHNNGGYGINSSYDTMISDCISDTNNLSGVYVKAPSYQMMNVKSYVNGRAAWWDGTAPAWGSGTPYLQGNGVIDPDNGVVYVARDAVTSTTKPNADATNWTKLDQRRGFVYSSNVSTTALAVSSAANGYYIVTDSGGVTGTFGASGAQFSNTNTTATVALPLPNGAGFHFEGVGNAYNLSGLNLNAEQNSGSGFYLQNAIGITVQGVASANNMNVNNSLSRATNFLNNAAVTLDGATGCNIDVNGLMMGPSLDLNTGPGSPSNAAGSTNVLYVVNSATRNHVRVATDTSGIVPTSANVGSGNIVSYNGTIVSALTVSGTLTASTTTQAAGDNSTKLASTAYVDAAVTGLGDKPDVQYASTSALPANTYANGSSGVGATLTGSSNGPLIIDGVTILVGQVGARVLVAGEAAPANDGWYTITQQGVVAVSPYILTRATESDQATEIGAGYLTRVIAGNTVTPGSANNGKVFLSVAADPFTVGTTALTFSIIGNAVTAGTGISVSGSAVSIDTSVTVDKTTAQTLTTKTLTTPILTGLPTGSGVASAATASTLAARDANANLTAVSVIEGLSSVTTAAGTTTLTVASNEQQIFTGTTTQAVVLPDTGTLVVGQKFIITNASTGGINVYSVSGATWANLVTAVPAGASAMFICTTASGTTPTSWSVGFSGTMTREQFPVASLWYPHDNFAGTLAPTLNTPYLYPIVVGGRHTWSNIGVRMTVNGAASSVVRLGIYADNGQRAPGVLVIDAGTVASVSGATTDLTKSLSSLVLPPGLYWNCMVCQVAGSPTATVRAGTATAGLSIFGLGNAGGGTEYNGYSGGTAVTGALSDPFAGTLTNLSTTPLICLQA